MLLKPWGEMDTIIVDIHLDTLIFSYMKTKGTKNLYGILTWRKNFVKKKKLGLKKEAAIYIYISITSFTLVISLHKICPITTCLSAYFWVDTSTEKCHAGRILWFDYELHDSKVHLSFRSPFDIIPAQGGCSINFWINKQIT